MRIKTSLLVFVFTAVGCMAQEPNTNEQEEDSTNSTEPSVVEGEPSDTNGPTDSTETSEPEDPDPAPICVLPTLARFGGEIPDCDDNGVSDSDELILGTSFDCNENGYPDACEFIDGCTLFGRQSYVEYDMGSLPIILSAPHGGSLQPDEIPDRPDYSTGSDLRTIELAQAIHDALETITGRRPHFIRCHLHRRKLECNRSLALAATHQNEHAIQAWQEYHRFIERAQAAATWGHAGGLYIDVHGLAASRDKNMLGYLVHKNDLGDSVTTDHPFARSSMRHLVSRGHLLSDILHCPQSMGSMLEAGGYPSIPSGAHPTPVDDELYYNGGYNTLRHGSHNGGVVDGFQLESIWDGVRSSAANRAAFAEHFAESLVTFMTQVMGMNIQAKSRVDWRDSEAHFSEVGGA